MVLVNYRVIGDGVACLDGFLGNSTSSGERGLGVSYMKVEMDSGWSSTTTIARGLPVFSSPLFWTTPPCTGFSTCRPTLLQAPLGREVPVLWKRGRASRGATLARLEQEPCAPQCLEAAGSCSWRTLESKNAPPAKWTSPCRSAGLPCAA